MSEACKSVKILFFDFQNNFETYPEALIMGKNAETRFFSELSKNTIKYFLYQEL